MKDYGETLPFLRSVCREIKAREMHPELKKELGSHLEELADGKEREGYSREEAVQWAIRQMGDPVEIGRSLNRIHKPRVHWGLLITTLLFSGIGILGMFSVSRAAIRPEFNSPLHAMMGNAHIRFIIPGLLIMLIMMLLDYRKLRSLSWPIYICTIAGMILVNLYPRSVNGSHRWLTLPIGSAIDVVGWSLYLLPASILGIWLSNLSLYRGRIIVRCRDLLLIGIPMFLYVRSYAIPELLIFLAVILILYIWLTGKWGLPIALGLVGVVIGGAAIWRSEYLSMRVISTLNPERFADGAGYMMIQMREALATAGWRGHGFGVPMPDLPLLYSDMLLPYLIYCFGWSVGLLLAAVMLGFLLQAIRAWKSVRDPYGRALLAGLSLTIILQLLYGLAKLSGYLILVNLPVPFISYGGSHLLIEYAALGLILSVFRRKDMIPGMKGHREAEM
ncbi:FtsW/RodA/SpoVE family cell cycle protein [Paenibacillus sp. HN-1]|uniref:FtsW/RodA/SpoVE family cell cycle protein n=1 Tax=Paenibacillus TaxID=44249 RepID=UPI001CA8E15D|nr:MULTISPECIES: FtsW/RodA/SpoVE family cell cycle protein [Paenibacillus]MBY9079280.1 FtsW/RodA/SpoVE family cell cycle protein [Paenibacillus sp. CGMCC 1.18879]MBY9087003.1 FtsW/RodA/SpoVE family cell cycle protein [Paenibacillus sinensis]